MYNTHIHTRTETNGAGDLRRVDDEPLCFLGEEPDCHDLAKCRCALSSFGCLGVCGGVGVFACVCVFFLRGWPLVDLWAFLSFECVGLRVRNLD